MVRLSTLGLGITIPKQDFSQGHNESQILAYENELRRANAAIAELKNKLSNVAGLEELHEQGEGIRRETAELLRYKIQGQGRGEDQAVLRELQLRL
jgi:hypothetical protein